MAPARRIAADGRAGPRFKLGTSFLVGAVAMTLLAFLVPVLVTSTKTFGPPGTPVADDGLGIVSTNFGPLTPLDREFVRKVRLAGLWELPAGMGAQQRAKQDSVREVGDHLVMGHNELNKMDIATAQELGIELPTKPSEQQQGWLDQIDAARGDAYERVLVNLLRRAHGTVFALVAQVRAQTQNSKVRALATRANTVVLDHISVLEATGLVDFDALADSISVKPVARIT
ncbi:DUF4142 domain-containing protein [Streptomyces sp. NPDC006733]|uniref:DUF4142 domain-containing protein n=1 Tax=Streptomyces sp. NPDC006733 TaxID=3155460 RepID=UPI0033CD7DAE